MGLDTLELRPFERADAVLLESATFPEDVDYLANTVLIDGEVTAYAGIHTLKDRHFAFFRVADTPLGRLLKDKAPLFIYRIVRDALRVIDEAGAVGEIHVLCDENYPKAKAFLTALGFARAERLPFDLLSIEAAAKSEMWVRRRA